MWVLAAYSNLKTIERHDTAPREIQLSPLIFFPDVSPIGQTSANISANLSYSFNPLSLPPPPPSAPRWHIALRLPHFANNRHTAKPVDPSIDVRVNERRPRQQRESNRTGGQAF